MKSFVWFCSVILFFTACKKERTKQAGCNMQSVYERNASKVTINKGFWGTVSSVEGDCMPTVGPVSNSCSNCPVQRTIKIYAFTTINNAIRSDPFRFFFDSFNTELVTSVQTDQDGFYQADIPAGKYTVVIVEDGKLHALYMESDGGINPVTINEGITNINLVMTYKAAF